MPGVWALPQQVPDFQTLPTLTPTPTPRGATATPTRLGPSATPTDLGAPTDTPVPDATPTETPGAGTPTAVAATPTAVAATPTAAAATPTAAAATPTRVGAAPAPIGPSVCWTSPTPGFEPLRLEALEFEVTSDQYLVVPGQTISFRLAAKTWEMKRSRTF